MQQPPVVYTWINSNHAYKNCFTSLGLLISETTCLKVGSAFVIWQIDTLPSICVPCSMQEDVTTTSQIPIIGPWLHMVRRDMRCRCTRDRPRSQLTGPWDLDSQPDLKQLRKWTTASQQLPHEGSDKMIAKSTCSDVSYEHTSVYNSGSMCT